MPPYLNVKQYTLHMKPQNSHIVRNYSLKKKSEQIVIHQCLKFLSMTLSFPPTLLPLFSAESDKLSIQMKVLTMLVR